MSHAKKHTLDDVRAAKRKAKRSLANIDVVNGIGIGKRDGEYVVKVAVSCEPHPDLDLPKEIDGVPIVVKVVGRIRKQSR